MSELKVWPGTGRRGEPEVQPNEPVCRVPDRPAIRRHWVICPAPTEISTEFFHDPIPCDFCGRAVFYRKDERYLRRFIAAKLPVNADCGDPRHDGLRRERLRERQRKTPAAKTCAVCGQQFTPTRSDAEYCSNACRQNHYRKSNSCSQ
jgi:hypothetical protein